MTIGSGVGLLKVLALRPSDASIVQKLPNGAKIRG